MKQLNQESNIYKTKQLVILKLGRVRAYLSINQNITNTQVRELCNFSRIQVKRTLEKMIEEKIIVRKGKGRGTHYVFLNQ